MHKPFQLFIHYSLNSFQHNNFHGQIKLVQMLAMKLAPASLLFN